MTNHAIMLTGLKGLIYEEQPTIAPIFSNRFRLPNLRLFFSQARLYPDRVELNGWSWRGRYQRQIPLAQIAEVVWWTGSPTFNLEIRLKDESAIGLWMPGAGRWKFAMDRDAARSLNRAPALPETRKHPTAA